MRGFSVLIQLIVEFFSFIFKKLGFNAVLVILLVIEVIAMSGYFMDNHHNYVYENDSHLEQVSDITLLEADDFPEAYQERVSNSESCYQITLQIGNYYINEAPYPTLHVTNQDNDIITTRRIGYYDDLSDYHDFYPQSVIPAGTIVQAPCIVDISEYVLDTTTELVIYHSYLEMDSISEKQLEQRQHILRIPFNTDK